MIGFQRVPGTRRRMHSHFRPTLAISYWLSGRRAVNLQGCCSPRVHVSFTREVRMEPKKRVCPDCEADNDVGLDRRDFLKTVGVTAAATTAGLPLWATPKIQAAPTPSSAAETAVKVLFDSLSDQQRKTVCFDWDYK